MFLILILSAALKVTIGANIHTLNGSPSNKNLNKFPGSGTLIGGTKEIQHQDHNEVHISLNQSQNKSLLKGPVKNGIPKKKVSNSKSTDDIAVLESISNVFKEEPEETEDQLEMLRRFLFEDSVNLDQIKNILEKKVSKDDGSKGKSTDNTDILESIRNLFDEPEETGNKLSNSNDDNDILESIRNLFDESEETGNKLPNSNDNDDNNDNKKESEKQIDGIKLPNPIYKKENGHNGSSSSRNNNSGNRIRNKNVSKKSTTEPVTNQKVEANIKKEEAELKKDKTELKKEEGAKSGNLAIYFIIGISVLFAVGVIGYFLIRKRQID